jgi:hypothetical protein
MALRRFALEETELTGLQFDQLKARFHARVAGMGCPIYGAITAHYRHHSGADLYWKTRRRRMQRQSRGY